MIPTTITTDDSIGIIYTTVIQFDYLMKGDEENYTCTLAIDGDSTEATFNLEAMSKLKYRSLGNKLILCIYEIISFTCMYINTHGSESQRQEKAGRMLRMSELSTGSTTTMKFINALNKPP